MRLRANGGGSRTIKSKRALAIEAAQLVEGVDGADLGALRSGHSARGCAGRPRWPRRGLHRTPPGGGRRRGGRGRRSGGVGEDVEDVAGAGGARRRARGGPMIRYTPVLVAVPGRTAMRTPSSSRPPRPAQPARSRRTRLEPSQAGHDGIVDAEDRGDRPSGRGAPAMRPSRSRRMPRVRHARPAPAHSDRPPAPAGRRPRSTPAARPRHRLAPAAMAEADPTPEESASRGSSCHVTIRQQSAGRGLNRPRPTNRPPGVEHRHDAARLDRAGIGDITLEDPRVHAGPRLAVTLQPQHGRSSGHGAQRTAGDGPPGASRGRRLRAAKDDHHQEGVLRLREHLVRLEPERPLHELEAAGQLHQAAQLLREHHA